MQIKNKQTGEVGLLHRDVRDRHAPWIHAQLGTATEIELQHMLDACPLAEYAENAGSLDDCGIFMSVDDADEYLDAERLEFAERGNGFPLSAAILVDHDNCRAYRVLPDAAPGDGRIFTHGPGQPNTTTLRVVAEDYEAHADDESAWEI